jgi:hypothetical protein
MINSHPLCCQGEKRFSYRRSPKRRFYSQQLIHPNISDTISPFSFLGGSWVFLGCFLGGTQGAPKERPRTAQAMSEGKSRDMWVLNGQL